MVSPVAAAGYHTTRLVAAPRPLHGGAAPVFLQPRRPPVLVGPLFTRELTTLPRRGRLYVARAAYGATLLVLLSTAWQVLAGMQEVRNVGDFARFGAAIFQVLAPLQLAAVMFLAALTAAASVAQEKDRRTFDLLLLTNLTNSELVLGKLFASLASVVDLVIAAVPVFAALPLFGGVGLRQVAGACGVTLAAALLAGSVGSTIALWREKTFQTLAGTALAVVAWTGLWEVATRIFGDRLGLGLSVSTWGAIFSPWHGLLSAMRPFPGDVAAAAASAHSPWSSTLAAVGLAVLLNVVAVWRVRVWNPSREIMVREAPVAAATDVAARWSLQALRAERTTATPSASQAVAARGLRKTRTVGDNPILWRETRTWAYGRKVIVLRAALVLMFAAALWNLAHLAEAPRVTKAELLAALVPSAVLGALLINMQAVTAVTSERDARALDLLLVTDLTPKEFVFGKLAGVFYNAKEPVVLPLVAAAAAWHRGLIGGETLVCMTLGWLTLAAFAAVLGLHVGMHYTVSRGAAAVSLATVFFLVVGVAVSMRIMTAFRGSFQAQLQPFLATIVGGGVGLYAALGRRNPSPAITLASFGLPLATFYAITSFLVDAALASLLAVMTAYGFAAAALLVPAVYEFDVATGRTTSGDDREA